VSQEAEAEIVADAAVIEAVTVVEIEADVTAAATDAADLDEILAQSAALLQ
jgi:hypothetical protein